MELLIIVKGLLYHDRATDIWYKGLAHTTIWTKYYHIPNEGFTVDFVIIVKIQQFNSKMTKLIA